MSAIKVKFELTEEQLEILKPLIEEADAEAWNTGHVGGIIVKINGYLTNLKAEAYYFPYEDGKFLQAFILVAEKGKAISDFMKLKKGKE